MGLCGYFPISAYHKSHIATFPITKTSSTIGTTGSHCLNGKAACYILDLLKDPFLCWAWLKAHKIPCQLEDWDTFRLETIFLLASNIQVPDLLGTVLLSCARRLWFSNLFYFRVHILADYYLLDPKEFYSSDRSLNFSKVYLLFPGVHVSTKPLGVHSGLYAWCYRYNAYVYKFPLSVIQ